MLLHVWLLFLSALSCSLGSVLAVTIKGDDPRFELFSRVGNILFFMAFAFLFAGIICYQIYKTHERNTRRWR